MSTAETALAEENPSITMGFDWKLIFSIIEERACTSDWKLISENPPSITMRDILLARHDRDEEELVKAARD